MTKMSSQGNVDEAEFLSLPSPTLRRLTQDERRAMVPLLSPRTFECDELICGWDDNNRPAGLFIVASGEVLLNYRPTQGRFRPREVLGPGQIFGAPLLPDIEPIDFTATATTGSRLLLLPSQLAETALLRMPSLRSLLELQAELARRRHLILPAFRHVALLSSTSPRHLAELLAEARVVRVEQDQELVQQGDEAHGFHYLLDGELHLMRDSNQAGQPPVLVHIVLPDDVVGDAALVAGDGREPATIVARRGPARLIHVPIAAWRGFLERSVVLQRSISAFSPSEAARASKGPAQVVLPMSSIRDVPLAPLIDLLAQAVARDHGDRVLLVTLPAQIAGTASPRLLPIDRGERNVDRLSVPVADGPGAADTLGRALSAVETDYDVIILDASDRGPGVTAHLETLVQRLVLITDDTFAPLRHGVPAVRDVVWTALLGRMRLRPTGPAYRAGTVRLRLDLARLRSPRPSWDELPAPTRETLSRWARAVTDRRVGIALGGGGAWGYAHVALLRAMIEKGVPVDMVSGASFGSVVASYFAARGREGLDLLMDRVWQTQLATQLGMISLYTMEWQVNRDLGSVMLEDLEIPFFPASTDLGSGSQRVVTRGTIGFGVRASGSFPGVFAPTRVRGARYVDGAISSNVPDDVLMPEGATLTVASNICAEPPEQPSSKPLFPGALGRFLADVNPVSRVQDLVRGTLILLHTVSNMDASTSDILFESPPVPYWFWQTTEGAKIEAAAAPDAQRTAAKIKRRWDALGDMGRGGESGA